MLVINIKPNITTCIAIFALVIRLLKSMYISPHFWKAHFMLPLLLAYGVCGQPYANHSHLCLLECTAKPEVLLWWMGGLPLGFLCDTSNIATLKLNPFS